MTCSIAPEQCLTKLQEGKQLHSQVEATQQKEVVLKARLGPWLDKAYQVKTTIQEKMASLQQTKEKIKIFMEDLAIEQLVEEVKQAAMQSDVEVGVMQVELVDLCNKITMPIE